MEILRTPDARFRDIPDYPFAPKYQMLGPLRMHYVDEGPSHAPPVLMLHGEPSWSFLYRHMIPIVAAAGHRVIAPDLIGFGKSDKPVAVADYSYAAHMGWLQAFIDGLGLDQITLVGQDWGSLLGLRLAAENPTRFRAIVIGNGMLPTGDQPVPAAFRLWKAFALNTPWFPAGRIVDLGCRKRLSRDEVKAYDAPFPTRRFQAGARAFPALVPVQPNDPATAANRAAWKVLEQWEKPFLTTFTNGDPITRGADRYLRSRIPGASGQPHVTLRGGHFLQEDCGTEFAQTLNQWLADLASEAPEVSLSGVSGGF